MFSDLWFQVRAVFRRWHGKFQSLKDETFQQRADDMIE